MQLKPTKIRLDAATICQLKCPTCLTTKGIIGKTLGSKILKIEQFQKIVDDNPEIRQIELSNWGEIFLNRDLLKIIEYAFEKNIALTAWNGVNLNTVTDEVLEGLVKFKFKGLSCSIDGASQETYKIYRQGGDFDTVISNVRKINEFKLKYKSELPRMQWQFVVFGHNEHELPLAREMADELGMKFFPKLSYDSKFSPIKNKEFVAMEIGVDVVTREDYQKLEGKPYLSYCSQIWNDLQINVDGRVLGCCINHWGDFGNVFQEDLTTILNGEKLSYARDMLMGKKEEREDIPCTQCFRYKDIKNTKGWLQSPS